MTPKQALSEIAEALQHLQVNLAAHKHLSQCVDVLAASVTQAESSNSAGGVKRNTGNEGR